MKTTLPSIIRYSFAAIAGISIASLSAPEPTFAQLNQPENQPGYSGQNANEPCAAGQNFSVFNLIHCAQLKNTRWDAYQSTGTIDSAAAEFRKKQQERFRKQQQTKNSTQTGTQLNIVPGSNTNESGQ